MREERERKEEGNEGREERENGGREWRERGKREWKKGVEGGKERRRRQGWKKGREGVRGKHIYIFFTCKNRISCAVI